MPALVVKEAAALTEPLSFFRWTKLYSVLGVRSLNVVPSCQEMPDAVIRPYS